MGDHKETKEDALAKIGQFIDNIRFGSITVVIHDGKVVQIEKHEKVRLGNE